MIVLPRARHKRPHRARDIKQESERAKGRGSVRQLYLRMGRRHRRVRRGKGPRWQCRLRTQRREARATRPFTEKNHPWSLQAHLHQSQSMAGRGGANGIQWQKIRRIRVFPVTLRRSLRAACPGATSVPGVCPPHKRLTHAASSRAHLNPWQRRFAQIRSCLGTRQTVSRLGELQ